MSGKHSQNNSDKSSLANKRGKTKENKNNKIVDNIFRVLTLIFFIITLVFYISVLNLNLLPGIYVTIFTVIEGLITLAIGIGLAKKHKKKAINIICLIIAIIISFVYIFATNYIFATKGFLDSMFSEVDRKSVV